MGARLTLVAGPSEPIKPTTESVSGFWEGATLAGHLTPSLFHLTPSLHRRGERISVCLPLLLLSAGDSKVTNVPASPSSSFGGCSC